jgi:predicted phage terminase large subunit-like protein
VTSGATTSRSPQIKKLLDCLPNCSPKMQAQILARLKQKAQAPKTDGDYLSFLRQSIPTAWTVDADHIRLIAQHIDAVERGDIDRLAIHMPPRHAKTETVTVRYGVYALQSEPAENVLITGYNERFARRMGRKARNVADGRIQMDASKQSADEWATTAGGVLMTRGVGSPPTGTGFRRIIIDDPIRRREDAESEVYREKVWDWYTDDLYTRLEPGGAIVLIMTLWHEDDIGARAVASEPGRWTVLKLPALAEENDVLGRPVGAALWPDRYDVPALLRIRDVMSQNEGLRGWEALFQQNPTPREGVFFKVSKLEIVDALPAGLRSCRAWDQASTENDGDYSAGVKMDGPDSTGIFYVSDVNRGQWATDVRNREIVQTARLDGPSVKIKGAQDPGNAGVDAAIAFTRMLSGFNVKTERVTGDKMTRADPFSAQVNAGNVRLVKGDWNKAYIIELRSFPNGKNDDQVDGSADAFNELSLTRRMRSL